MRQTDLTGHRLGQYALGRRIGSGGMGCVFLARHSRLQRDCAIKFITGSANDGDDLSSRFDLETVALGKLQHPNIVNAMDAGCHDGLKYLVTELVEGADLGQLVDRRGPLRVCDACELIRQAAVGLSYSHQNGFLHRDIKPSNLILDRSGVVKVLDFGLVRCSKIKQGLTVDGQIMGTLDFLAPEQAQDSSSVDERADIYSLGCTLLYLLSGHVPFDHERYSSMVAKLKGHLFDEPDWLKHPPAHVPQELKRILSRMMAKEPDRRYQSAHDVAEALAPWTEGAELHQLLAGPGQTQRSGRPLSTRSHLQDEMASSRQALIAGGVASAVLVGVVSLTVVFMSVGRVAGDPDSLQAPDPKVAATESDSSSRPHQPNTRTAVPNLSARVITNDAANIESADPVESTAKVFSDIKTLPKGLGTSQ